MQRQKKAKNGEQLTKADVVEEIKNLEGITYDDLGNTIEGEFQEYIYTIDKDFNVIVGEKVSGGDILYVHDNVSLAELKVVINEIKYKGLTIVHLNDLIKEQDLTEFA